MSIATRTGDEGTTSLMYGKRVSKTDARVCAYGAVDELNSTLGLARASATDPFVSEAILLTQKELVNLMGELACHTDDQNRYAQSKYPMMSDDMLARLDQLVKKIEADGIEWEGWATPGANIHAAAMDMSRSICRRAEREIVKLMENGTPIRPLIIQYMNRLSDVLWLLARLEETKLHGKKSYKTS